MGFRTGMVRPRRNTGAGEFEAAVGIEPNVHRFAGGPLATRACDRAMLSVSPPRVELGQPNFGRSAADSAAGEARRYSRVRRLRWARQESNLHSRSDRFTAGCSRHMISSPVGCLTGTAPADTRVTAGSLAFWVQAPVGPAGVEPAASVV